MGPICESQLASYEGLATTQIKPGDLAAALGVGSMSELLGTQVLLSKLYFEQADGARCSSTKSAICRSISR
ncbi:MAG: hypothetical protein ABSD12_02505 [Paraburkholderia sp.]